MAQSSARTSTAGGRAGSLAVRFRAGSGGGSEGIRGRDWPLFLPAGKTAVVRRARMIRKPGTSHCRRVVGGAGGIVSGLSTLSRCVRVTLRNRKRQFSSGLQSAAVGRFLFLCARKCVKIVELGFGEGKAAC